MPTVSVIISTYNSPQWLRKAIWGWSAQTDRDFELVIADDGSTEETRRTIEELRQDTGLAIRHVWHEDRGFRKCEILNKAIVASAGDYLVFSDGDCIPRCDFVQAHRAAARPGRFLAGGYYNLPADLSALIGREDILSGRVTDLRWLGARGLPWHRRRIWLWPWPRLAAVLDNLTKRHEHWHGANSSAWRADIMAVNGFDERMGWGMEDCEFGFRLENSGIRPVRVRYRAITLHLEHTRGYVNQAQLPDNEAICAATERSGLAWTPYGIIKAPAAKPGEDHVPAPSRA